VATNQYRPQLLSRIGQLDLNRLTQNVAADLALAKEWQPGINAAGSRSSLRAR